MTTLAWKRNVEVSVAGVLVRDLKIVFNIKLQADDTPPHGNIDIYNLRQETEQQIDRRGQPIRLDAGYGVRIGNVFQGIVGEIVKEREGTDRVTRIRVTGEVTGAGGGVTSTRAYEGFIPVHRIVADLVEDLGLRLGSLDPIPADATINGFYWVGSTRAALDSVLDRVDVSWYEDRGVIHFNRVRVTSEDIGAALVLSPRSGLIGTPSTTDEGARARSVLRPDATLGKLVRLESMFLGGTWKTIGLVHAGTNWLPGDFFTDFELRALA